MVDQVRQFPFVRTEMLFHGGTDAQGILVLFALAGEDAVVRGGEGNARRVGRGQFLPGRYGPVNAFGNAGQQRRFRFRHGLERREPEHIRELEVDFAVETLRDLFQVIEGQGRIGEAEAVVEGFGDGRVEFQVAVHFVFGDDGVDAQRIELDGGAFQLVGQKVVFLGRHGLGTVRHVDFEITVPRRVGQVVLVHLLQEHDGLAVFQDHAVQGDFLEGELVVAQLEFGVQVGLVDGFLEVAVQFAELFLHFVVRPCFDRAVHAVAAVDADAAVVVQQGFDYVAFVFKGRRVGGPAAFIARGQDAPRSGVHGFQEIAVQGRTLRRREIDQDGLDLLVFEEDRQLAVDDAQPIAEGHAHAVDAARGRGGPADEAAHQGRIVRDEREKAGLDLPGLRIVNGFERRAFPLGPMFGLRGAYHGHLAAFPCIHQRQITVGNHRERRRHDLSPGSHQFLCEFFLDCHITLFLHPVDIPAPFPSAPYTESLYHKLGVFAIPRNAYIFKVVQYIMLCKTSKIRGN